MANNRKHISELQSLRGIAAMAVMIGHALVYYRTPTWFSDIAVLPNGRAAVVVFFVLSGFVLTRSLQDSAFDRPAVVQFYVQRLFRIYPAMLVASVVGLGYILFLHWQIRVPDPGELILHAYRPDRYDFLHIAASFAGMTTFVLPQLWTIFVELVASVAMPAFAFIALHQPRWQMVALLGVAALVSVVIPNTYYHTTMYMVDFVVGAALAAPWMTPFRLPPIIPVAAMVCLSTTQWLPLTYWSPFANLIELGLATVTIGTLVATRRPEWMASRPLLFIGDVSYSLYLLHFPVMCILAKVFVILGITGNGIELSILLACCTTAATVPLAWASYVYIEKPGIRLGRMLWNKRTRYVTVG